MKRPHPGLHHLTVAVHICFGLSILHRPYLPLILPSYARFDDIMPWLTWGWCALLVGAWMALARPGTLAGQSSHFLSSVWFFLVAGVFAAGAGTTSAVTTYTVLAFGSLALFASDFRLWFPGLRWVRHLSEHPPRWARERRGD